MIMFHSMWPQTINVTSKKQLCNVCTATGYRYNTGGIKYYIYVGKFKRAQLELDFLDDIVFSLFFFSGM